MKPIPNQLILLKFQFKMEKKTLFIIGHVFPEPATTAAGSRMMQLITLFLNAQYNVVFGTTAQETSYSETLSAYNITTHKLELNSSSFDALVKNISPTIVMFDRFITEEQFGWRVEANCPEAIRILDTEDLHFLREARRKELHKGVKENALSDLAKRELASIYRCDITLIISEYEFNLLKNTYGIPEHLLFYFPLCFSKPIIENKRSFVERSDFITIGNLKHAPNVDAVLYLHQEIWPSIKEKLPNAVLKIFGAYAPEHIKALHNPKNRFLVLGWADDIEAVMSTARVCLAPLRFGAGIKGKILDAIYYCTPCVTTTIGIEGVSITEDYPGKIANSSAQFIDEAIKLYTDKSDWEKVLANRTSTLISKFQIETYRVSFMEKINELHNALALHREKNIIGQILGYHLFKSTKYLSKWIELKNKS